MTATLSGLQPVGSQGNDLTPEQLDYALKHLAYHLNEAGLYKRLEQLASKWWLDMQLSHGKGKKARRIESRKMLGALRIAVSLAIAL
jgi:hypothetical protein